ncbi:rRNA maturation RNase YbeY [Aurantibacter crassamenti]|uniref:rRNA maturation RNase YbeY n=1 Tax=Aurantibacter crassamenti TaxID=1837375 RepID=UPI001939C6D0|nr:rRNA maturation RNase YbeY [Aurantibacter crassamenti]MBM1105230.1 rRNA maturation RNase YbeY [Aurantibacter crassamenti]
MIEYHYETDFKLDKEENYSSWLNNLASSEGKTISQINYIFCDDSYLLELNIKHLNHNTLTDILTFDYAVGSDIVADIFISVERVTDNAEDLGVIFEDELLRVMAHGVLHIIGYKDKTAEESVMMREKEEEKIKMFHVEQ